MRVMGGEAAQGVSGARVEPAGGAITRFRWLGSSSSLSDARQQQASRPYQVPEAGSTSHHDRGADDDECLKPKSNKLDKLFVPPLLPSPVSTCPGVCESERVSV